MTKQDVKDLCEADPQLQWWAMVLFAELCGQIDSIMYMGNEEPLANKLIAQDAKYRIAEFPKIVVNEQLRKAKESLAESPEDVTDAYLKSLTSTEME